jgi:hypothetical protein
MTSESQRYRLTRITFLALLILYWCGTVFGGIGLGAIATHPGRRPITSADEERVRSYSRTTQIAFRDVSVSAEDGAVLRGWFLSPYEPNGHSVILLHGVSDNRLGMYGYGQWLLEHHYSVLLPDARAHGLSGGEIATYGIKEADDIHRWVNWLEDNANPNVCSGLANRWELLKSCSRFRESPGSVP